MGYPHVVKRCSECRKIKPVDEFYKAKTALSGRDAYCKKCRRRRDRIRKVRQAEIKKRKRENPKVYARHLNRRLLSLYGITYKKYLKMFERQGGACNICLAPETRKLHGNVARLVVDHNHYTKKVRGLLCHACNVKLAIIEDEQFMLLAKEYVRQHDGYEFVRD